MEQKEQLRQIIIVPGGIEKKLRGGGRWPNMNWKKNVEVSGLDIFFVDVNFVEFKIAVTESVVKVIYRGAGRVSNLPYISM